MKFQEAFCFPSKVKQQAELEQMLGLSSELGQY